MRTKTKLAAPYRFLLLGLLVIMVACAINPVTGKKEFMLVTNADEMALGKQTDILVTEQYGIYPDQKLQEYLTQVGLKIVPNTHRPDLPYTFKVVDTDIVNAFAVPGGYVYFTRGIMAYLNDEAEMAGVMGHELGHVSARHTAEQITKSQVVQLGFGLGSMLSETFRQYAGLANFGVELLFLRFSRDNERQSDDLGVEYSTKSGYDANRMADFFVTLERMQPSDGSAVPAWFSTHPNPVDRVTAVKAKTNEWQAKYPNQKFAVNQEEYLQKLDGIVFGPDPRQGYVQAQTFYHPTLTLKFAVPVDWQVNNLPSQVQMAPKTQDAVMLFTIAKEADPASAAAQFVSQANANVSKNVATKVNGMPAQELQADILSGQDTVRVLSYFIQKENQVFVFHGVSSRDKFASFMPNFLSTMTSFDQLRDPRFLNVKPKRLRIERVRTEGTLRQVLAELSVAQTTYDQVSLLNGMMLDDPVRNGTLLKIIVQ